MRIIVSILIFYKKLVLPALTMAMAFSFLEYAMTEKFTFTTLAIYYILMSMFFHYFIYEKRNPGEYYFYYNMGLSKFVLWGISLFLSFIISLVLVIIGLICM